MITGHDHTRFEGIWIDIPQKKLTSAVAGPLHSKLLIKIAVVNFATPADTDRAAAHQSPNCSWIKRVNEQLHVFLEFIVVPEIAREPADWKICERVKVIKHNSEMLFELVLEIDFQRSCDGGRNAPTGL